MQVAKPSELVGTGELAVNKFGMGFTRRHESTIQNESADVIRRHSADWAIQAKMINDDRREMLTTTDSKYKYDLITGTMRPYQARNGVVEKPIGKRIHPHEGLGPEALHRGAEYLRESRYKPIHSLTYLFQILSIFSLRKPLPLTTSHIITIIMYVGMVDFSCHN